MAIRFTPPAGADALVARAQSGDVGAFEALVAAHLPQVRRFARAFAAREEDVDDLAQEALLKVHRSLRLFRGRSSFSSWLYAVVRHVAIDAARSRAARERALQEPLRPEHAEVACPGRSPDAAHAQEEASSRLWRALRAVAVEQRAALVLVDIEGHSYEEAAALEAVPVGTVKSRLSRGRAQLRRLLVAGEAPDREAQPARGGRRG